MSTTFTTNAYTPMKFYTSKICPFAQRVSITLYELGLLDEIKPGKYSDGLVELIDIDLKNKPDWYARDVNPQGKVPSLQVTTSQGNKQILVESTYITEFLLQANHHPGTLMDPKLSLNRYRSNLLFDWFSHHVMGNFFSLLKEKDAAKQSDLSSSLIDNIKHLQSLLSADGHYALGQDFSIVDILIAPFLARFSILEHYRQFKVPDTPEFHRYHEWCKALFARPSVQRTTADINSLIDAYKPYAL